MDRRVVTIANEVPEYHEGHLSSRQSKEDDYDIPGPSSSRVDLQLVGPSTSGWSNADGPSGLDYLAIVADREHRNSNSSSASSSGCGQASPSSGREVVQQNGKSESDFDTSCHFAEPGRPCQYMAQASAEPMNKRFVISHFFGRNKVQTRRIPARIRVNTCRKHYQRTKYRHTQFALIQLQLIRRQIDQIEQYHPATTWTFHFQKALHRRYNKSAQHKLKQGQLPIVEVRTESRKGASEEKDPLLSSGQFLLVEHLAQFVGKEITTETVRYCCSFIEGGLNDQLVAEFPLIEFLPNLPPGPQARL